MRMLGRMLLLAAAVASGRGEISAGTIEVLPGPGTPFQSAIDAAAPGDTLRVQGTFTEAVVVNKRLKIRPSSGATWYIEAGCGVATAFDVVADHVSVRGSTGMSGGTAQTVRVQGTRVTFTNLAILSSCSSGDGMRVESSTDVNIRLRDSDIEGWDAGLRLVSLPSGGRFRLIGTGFIGSTVSAHAPTGAGVVIENSGAGSALGRSGIQLVSKVPQGHASPHTFGIDRLRLVGSDGIMSRRVFWGVVEADADSDNNEFAGGAMGAIIDGGTGNCGRGSFYDRRPPNLAECP